MGVTELTKISLTTRLRRIGNSQGVILPQAVLGLPEIANGSRVALRGDSRRIVLEPIGDHEAATLQACEAVSVDFGVTLDVLEDSP